MPCHMTQPAERIQWCESTWRPTSPRSAQFNICSLGKTNLAYYPANQHLECRVVYPLSFTHDVYTHAPHLRTISSNGYFWRKKNESPEGLQYLPPARFWFTPRQQGERRRTAVFLLCSGAVFRVIMATSSLISPALPPQQVTPLWIMSHMASRPPEYDISQSHWGWHVYARK